MQVELMLQKPQFPEVFEETKLYNLLGVNGQQYSSIDCNSRLKISNF